MIDCRQPPPPAPAADTRTIVPPVVSRRQQPPLKEVMQGLDARELEGETVFDQLFGPQTSP
jgi:hypothetical protein